MLSFTCSEARDTGANDNDILLRWSHGEKAGRLRCGSMLLLFGVCDYETWDVRTNVFCATNEDALFFFGCFEEKALKAVCVCKEWVAIGMRWREEMEERWKREKMGNE